MLAPPLAGLGLLNGRQAAASHGSTPLIPGLLRKSVRETEPAYLSWALMVRIWLPTDTRRRLLEALPTWSRAHKALIDATEIDYAVGLRRVSCTLPDARGLLQVAERVDPESAPLIRIAIRKARATHSTPGPLVPSLPPALPRQARERRASVAHLRRLVTLHVLVFTFPVLQFLDRAREFLRRVL